MDASMFIVAVDGLQHARFTSAAATTIYLYNIVITLDLEMEYIWSRLSFNLPTLLYITSRYICLVPFLVTMYGLSGFTSGFSDAYCKIPFDAVGIFLSYVAWTGLMKLRVCALWRQNLLVVRFVQGTWVCVMVTVILTTAFSYYKEILPTIVYNPAMRICAPTINPQIFKATPIAPVFYETLLTILTIIKVFDFGMYPSRATLPMLYRVIIRDGVIYFVVSATVMATNMIAWYTLPGGQLYLLCSLYWAIMSTFMANLVLNLRVAHHESLFERLGHDGMEATTGYEIGAYGTKTEWNTTGTMGYRARYIPGGRDMRMVASTVDGGDEDEPWNV